MIDFILKSDTASCRFSAGATYRPKTKPGHVHAANFEQVHRAKHKKWEGFQFPEFRTMGEGCSHHSVEFD